MMEWPEDIEGISPLLWTEDLYPSNSYALNPQCDGIRRCGPWEEIRFRGGPLMMGFSPLQKGGKEGGRGGREGGKEG